jgi:hypothetical protein
MDVDMDADMDTVCKGGGDGVEAWGRGGWCGGLGGEGGWCGDGVGGSGWWGGGEGIGEW